MIQPPFALKLRLVFLLQLFVMHPLGLLGRMFLIQLPALPDRRQSRDDFVVVQPFRPGAQAVGRLLD